MAEDEVLRVGGGSGFYGDRFEAMAELVEGGPLDVLTGDYLAELTMLILWRTRRKDPHAGYARSFLRQARELLVPCLDRGIRIVVNAGGLNPSGLADALGQLAGELGRAPRIAQVAGDDLLPRLDELTAAGHAPVHAATGAPLAALATPPITANAYLGAAGIARALSAGADVVITGRVTDASLTVGPAMWRFGWRRDDHDRIAGAMVAGHVIECGAQATGGNYAFFTEVAGLEHVGFPIAELHADGSSVITKHDGTGGIVSVGTVTAQLLYEVEGPRYLGPDAVARLDHVQLTVDGDDRVRISNVRGEPPPMTRKVAVNTLGGFRNQATFLLTGLDIEAKADLVRRQLARRVDLDALDRVDVQLVRSDQPDAPTNAQAIATMTITVEHHDPETISRRRFGDACVALALASYPGFALTAPPRDAEPFGRYWPGLIAAARTPERVTLPDGRVEEVPAPAPHRGSRSEPTLDPPAPPDPGSLPSVPSGPRLPRPLGLLAGARSGDKGGDANVGLWVRDPSQLGWLVEVAGDPEAARTLLPEAAGLDIEVHVLPRLSAVNIVVRGLLGEGVASAVRVDPQAKGLGEYLRSRIVDIPSVWLRSSDEAGAHAEAAR
ncbi:MAG: acyclic terpene utilization AtuA family protein [Nitriliruptoraceae bacterium]